MPEERIADLVASPRPAVSRLREVQEAGFIHCVYLTCFQEEYSILPLVLRYSSIRMHRAETLDAADFLLTVTGGTVLLTDLAFLDGCWLDAMEMAARIHPLVASLVVADRHEGPSPADAWSNGACGVLHKPIDISRAIQQIRVVHEAVRERVAVLRGDSSASVLPASIHRR